MAERLRDGHDRGPVLRRVQLRPASLVDELPGSALGRSWQRSLGRVPPRGPRPAPTTPRGAARVVSGPAAGGRRDADGRRARASHDAAGSAVVRGRPRRDAGVGGRVAERRGHLDRVLRPDVSESWRRRRRASVQETDDVVDDVWEAVWADRVTSLDAAGVVGLWEPWARATGRDLALGASVDPRSDVHAPLAPGVAAGPRAPGPGRRRRHAGAGGPRRQTRRAGARRRRASEAERGLVEGTPRRRAPSALYVHPGVRVVPFLHRREVHDGDEERSEGGEVVVGRAGPSELDDDEGAQC